MTKGINLFTACFLFILAASLPQSIKSHSSKCTTNNYDYYSPWSPGDAGVYVDKDGYIFNPYMSRFPKDCEKKSYINLGKWQRISDEVRQTPKGTFFCRNESLKRETSTNGLFSCTKEGWVKKSCMQGRCVMGGMGDL
ncbi:hypothetical protein PMIT1320_00136 [Prochlorococcus marinus str. MIT 1320]|nr:hypothetical protein PMIT1320_00136 [Prochlorococcus marinus str. MIT 1320]